MQQSSSDGTESEGGWPSAEGVLVAAGSIAPATESDSDESPAEGSGAGINLALPPQEEMQDRETRTGQSGSASEANNEGTPANDSSGGSAAPLQSTNPFAEEGNALPGETPANVRRDENYQPNTPGNSAPANYADGGTTNGSATGTTPPPPEPQPAVQDGSSNTVIIAEGGSELNPDVTGEKHNSPGTNGASSQQSADAAPGYDADGNPLPGAEGRVTLDDWTRLNDRDGDGQVDRNYVDLSGDTSNSDGGEPTGAPPGAVGDGIPVPSADMGGVKLEDRIPGSATVDTGGIGESIPVPDADMGRGNLEDRLPGGGTTDTGATEPTLEGRPGLDGLPGLRGRVPDVPYEQEGTGLPPGSEPPNGVGTFPPGVGELLDKDGDGRPDTRLPGAELPTLDPPVRGPGLTIPEDLGPREPGPEFEPGVDITPPGNGGAHPPGAEHPPGDGGAYTPPVAETPPGGNGTHYPSDPEMPQAGHDAAPIEPPAQAGVESPGAVTPTAGESLDVFLVPPAQTELPSGDAPAPEPVSAAPAWTLTASPAIAQGGGTEVAADAVHPATESESGELGAELTALIASLRAAADTATGAFSEAWKRDPDGPNVLERLLEMLRDALFMGDGQPSDDELASQLAGLEPSALVELERYAREHQPMGADPGDGLEGDG